MQTHIYLDNSATTKPCKTAIDKINTALCDVWGNPSSLHNIGVDAEIILTNVRDKISSLINCRPDEVFFTSGGTESNNIAILGTAKALKRRGNKIVTTSIEHPSVLNTCKSLEQDGFEIVYIKPEKDGSINSEKIINAVDDQTILVSMMLVNNETGAILPLKEVTNRLKTNGYKGYIHTDCVQAFGKININIQDLGVDLLSASGHKIHGPKGVGFLYKSKKINLKPIIFGGEQEKGLRSGTESVPLISGLGGAIDELDILSCLNKVNNLYNYAIEELQNKCNAIINSPKTDFLPYIINASFLGFRSETLLHFLENQNIFVSSGSACSKGKGSHVLNEMGLDRNRIDSALRISFSRYNEKSDIDALCRALCLAQKSLKKK